MLIYLICTYAPPREKSIFGYVRPEKKILTAMAFESNKHIRHIQKTEKKKEKKKN